MPPLRAWPAALAVCIASGLLIAAALPPIGLWPLALAGVFLLDWALAGQSVGPRFVRGAVAEAAVLFPTLTWMTAFTVPGYLVAALVMSAMFGVGAMLVPPDAPARWLGLPAAIVLVEAVRARWPFGGVPLSTLAYAEVSGPLAPTARLGGALLLIGVTVVTGVVLAALARRAWRPAVAGAGVVALSLALAAVAPRGERTGEIEAALVQGGGPQGTQASDTDADVVFERHLDATELVPEHADLVVWPEDIVDLDGRLAGSRQEDVLAALARRLDATLVVGITEQEDDRFRNAAVAFNPDGTIADRYEKVRRVPFGEYVPLRWLVGPFGADEQIPRDAVAGTEPAVLDTDLGRLGVVISWEVWFGDRAGDAIGNGGRILLNPTNGSSYSGTIVQTQQVAASRLRAIETGRWVLQVAPTGFTAIISDTGEVMQRTGISERAVLSGTVEMRNGQTMATRAGDSLPVGLAAVGLAVAWWWWRRTEGTEGTRGSEGTEGTGGSEATDGTARLRKAPTERSPVPG